jgi:DNA-binding CsgD family transcriptional regulator
MRRLLERFGLRRAPGLHTYGFDATLQAKLSDLASQRGLSEEELASDLLAAGLQGYADASQLLQEWRALSPREQDVTALACLGYTNRQIAAGLGISPETVKTHLGNVLSDLGLHSRQELRLLFSGWDFGAWEE